MPSDTRDRVIQIAHELFYRNGFHAVGLDAIITEAGITKTTFYNHFPSKEDLVAEVLRMHDRWWQDSFRQLLRKHGGDTPRGQLMAIFDGLEELFCAPGYNGCFFVNVAVQFPAATDPTHAAAAEHKRAMESILRELAGYAGATDAAALAQELSLIMEGAYVTRQVTANPETGQIARRVANLVLEKYLLDGSID